MSVIDLQRDPMGLYWLHRAEAASEAENSARAVREKRDKARSAMRR